MNPEVVSAEVADRLAITEQMYRYCRSVDRLDVALGHGVFHEDSTATFGEYIGSGRGWIDYVCVRHLDFLHHSHQVTNTIIEIDGARAGSEAYVFATLHRQRDGDRVEQSQFWARYVDRWSKRDGTWAVDTRLCVVDFATIAEVVAPASYGGATRDRGDPSYAVFGALIGEPA